MRLRKNRLHLLAFFWAITSAVSTGLAIKPATFTLKETDLKRYHWLYVHCKLKLLHPKLVRLLINLGGEAWIDRTNYEGKIIRIHLARQHQAICDYLLPYAHNTPLASNAENPVSSCTDCNFRKSDSTDQQSWRPNQSAPWNEPLMIGSSILNSGDFEAFCRVRLIEEKLNNLKSLVFIKACDLFFQTPRYIYS